MLVFNVCGENKRDFKVLLPLSRTLSTDNSMLEHTISYFEGEKKHFSVPTNNAGLVLGKLEDIPCTGHASLPFSVNKTQWITNQCKNSFKNLLPCFLILHCHPGTQWNRRYTAFSHQTGEEWNLME